MFSFLKRKRAASAIIIMMGISVPVLSQKPMLSLAALNDSADHYLPRLLEKKALVNSASSYITETRNQFLPFIRFNDQVNIASDNSLAGSYYSFGIIPSSSAGVRAANDYQAASGNIAVLAGEYDLVDFGYKNARIQYAQSAKNLSQSDLQREMYILHGRICRSYFNLMMSEARMAVEKETVKRYDTILNIISALTMSGIKPGSDSSLAKAELSKSRITYNQINEQVKNYREEISYLTGVAQDQIVTDSTLILIGKRKDILQMPADTAVNPLIDYYSNLSKLYLSNERLISKSYLPKSC
jgi:outer membrane protein TolC